ncbi:hypothetical protein HDIA_0720 [Hartmannibacter diazotrophicus]|uniref:Uncharacterized protein n=1 Tax=Hartmannibacter diazotrophicus TaxID=1482074 RepID=A0A2C9D3A4_9HYPH|nr:hypothetical protein HDIA_0720 [Hartmannibacter diazotrophicus]
MTIHTDPRVAIYAEREEALERLNALFRDKYRNVFHAFPVNERGIRRKRLWKVLHRAIAILITFRQLRKSKSGKVKTHEGLKQLGVALPKILSNVKLKR